jgi:uncharacterized protein with HEPN domain
MSRHRPELTLRQMAEAAERLETLCAGCERESFLADWQKRAALERFIEILGEAVKRLPPELREKHPAIEWRRIAGARDRIIHAYDDVDHTVLWEAVRVDVPVLRRTITEMLGDL